MPDGASCDTRSFRRQVRRALLLKEWHEQRWRFLLGTMVMSGMLAGMLRAQVIPHTEAALAIFWPVGVLMVIFLAMGPVAAEKSDRTWEFLLAQPVSRADVLLAKWRMGMIQLVGMMSVATLSGLLAMWSRGFYGMATIHQERVREGYSSHLDSLPQALIAMASAHPGLWVFMMGVVSTVALACWYTPLFIVLTRARNEFAAALGGILLAIMVHAWLIHVAVFFEPDLRSPWFAYALLNPLLPLALSVSPKSQIWLPLAVVTHIGMWIVLPVLILKKLAGRARRA